MEKENEIGKKLQSIKQILDLWEKGNRPSTALVKSALTDLESLDRILKEDSFVKIHT
jgi:hypothetical protein